MMLIYLPEDDAFYCFVAALKDPRFNLRRLYLPAMADAQKVLFVYGELCGIIAVVLEILFVQ